MLKLWKGSSEELKECESLRPRLSNILLMQPRFRWVSLQIDNLCDPYRMNHESDVEQELGRLPRTLKDSYQIIHERIKSSAPTSKSMADRAIAWLLCATHTLKSSPFLAAVSMDSKGRHYELSPRDLLNMCCNLAVWDQVSDRFRFAHLSVQEYFQSQEEYSSARVNEIALTRCVNVFIAQANSISKSEDSPPLNADLQYFMKYATISWPYHYNATRSPKCRGRVEQFLFQDSGVAPAFKIWMATARETIGNGKFYRRMLEEYWPVWNVRQILCTPSTPVLLACMYGWNDVLEKLCALETIDVNQCDDEGTTSALRLALWCSDTTNTKLLLKLGADVNFTLMAKAPLCMRLWNPGMSRSYKY